MPLNLRLKRRSRNLVRGSWESRAKYLRFGSATANVVANEAVEAFFLDRATLQSLFELFPHLGSRFYHSLAAILSRRLREVIDPKSAKAKEAQD